MLVLTPLIWATIRLQGWYPGQGLVRDLEDRYRVDGTGDYSPIDEREAGERNRASYQALRIIRVVFTIAWFGSGFLSERYLSHIKDGFLTVFLLLLWTLPQSILLWTEPDMEEAP
jgi:hypothetical protein